MSRPNPQQSTSTILVGLGSVPATTVVVTQDNRNHHHHNHHQHHSTVQPQQIIVPTNSHPYLTTTPPPAHYNSPWRDNTRRQDPRVDYHNSHTHSHSYR
ncbi:hypothetical protein ACQUW5_11325 [Legionella sp. CNM-1927-20]|uniref:hypothetical protein n=1 Tax=Legionella sp. CNM-1927-20 TaxID=3422221 RepID=UPI00403ADB2B